MSSRLLCSFLILTTLLVTLPWAEEIRAADIRELAAETQRMSEDPKRGDLAWWIPTEFWRVAILGDGRASEADFARFEKTLSPYLLFVVVDGKIGPFGEMSWTTPEQLWPTLQLTDPAGDRHRSMKLDTVSP